MKCPSCDSTDLTAFYEVDVAFDFSGGHLGGLLTEPTDIRDQVKNHPHPTMIRCDDCEREWPPNEDAIRTDGKGEP
jgi:hypothetical protein